MKNITFTLIGLRAMRAFGSLSEQEFISKINQLCDEYGTETVVAAMMRLGLD